MAKGILGRKVGMTQIFTESGEAVPVTVLQVGPCTVLQVRTSDRDGYDAIQLGFDDKPRRLARRSERGHVAKLNSKRSRRRAAAGIEISAKAGSEPKRFVREIRGPVDGAEVGQELTVEIFNGVAAVDVSGVTKGRGFAGVIKRHHFAGQRASHGVKKVHRHPGSTGNNTFPARTWRGKRMAGHLGHDNVTIRNIKVVRVDPENNLLLIHGGVPGPNGGFVVVRETNKVG
jgi:large subunit ribosomal protein L3